MYKEGKWANQILELQDNEGKWGCFHSLSQFYDAPMTTEQALRRLEILGYTMKDACIQNAVSYMEDCLYGRKTIPDRREKASDWDVFSRLILATWVRRFSNECYIANQVAEQWAEVITSAFSLGYYDESCYQASYRHVLSPQYGRINGFAMFYPVSLLRGCLDEQTERLMVSYLLNCNEGIYYIYDRKLMCVPAYFESRKASRYLGAVELLADYPTARNQLWFVADWLISHRNSNGRWDMGKSVNDKVYFPLSDNWRRRDVREFDCTVRIERLLHKIC